MASDLGSANSLATWGLYGNGLIGRKLVQTLGNPEVATAYGLEARPRSITTRRGGTVDADGVSINADEMSEARPDLVFTAISSEGNGQESRGIILGELARGAGVIACDKAGIAYFGDEIAYRAEGRVGDTATVGGGTQMLRVLKMYSPFTAAHAVVNGTLQKVFGDIGPLDGRKPMDTATALQEAIDLGFAEPSGDLKVEVGDVRLKLRILLGKQFPGENIDLSVLDSGVPQDEIDHALSEAQRRRYVLSLLRRNRLEGDPLEGVIGGFAVDTAEFVVIGGFQNIENRPELADLARLSGGQSGVSVDRGEAGIYFLKGPGAGPGPTVGAMLSDVSPVMDAIQGYKMRHPVRAA